MKGENAHQNLAQWPSFGHVGIYYSNLSTDRITQLSIPAIFIQRWWRQRTVSRPRQKLYPIIINKRAYNVKDTLRTKVQASQDEDPISWEIAAYEKLDGTNLGVRCDGAVFGRRYRVEGDSYQRVPLEGAIPTETKIRAVKTSISQVIGYDDKDELPKLVLYGELMCNPGKYGYNSRGMAKKFFCFGAVLDANDTKLSVEEMGGLCQKLNDCNLHATLASQTGQVRICMNDKLAQMVEAEGIQCAPLLDKGPLRELCFRMKEMLMGNGMEGVVLTGKGGLMKWKTNYEDESKGYELLYNLLNSHSIETLKLAGVDIGLAQLLLDVAKRSKPIPIRGQKKKKAKNNENPKGYEKATLDSALASAMSKYDDLDAYFESGERDAIRTHLKKELVAELCASTDEEIKVVNGFVDKVVGVAFGKWKKRMTTTS